MTIADLAARKGALRRRAYERRNAQANKDAASAAALERFLELPAYRQAATVMWYLDIRSELRTRAALPAVLETSRTVVVPYCTVDTNGDNHLGLWRLESLDEMISGKWDILEPPRDRWAETGKTVAPEELDLIMVPGVAFSRNGARLGNGQGYYDRLLARVRQDTTLAAICYESQLFEGIPEGSYDVRMHCVVTETAVYPNC